MMKLFYKITVLVVVIFAVILIPFDQTATYAGHQKSVLSAVESAGQQDVPEEVITRLLAYALDNQLSGNHTIHLLSILIEVREAKFPLRPFLEKIQEGLTKQVNPENLENGLIKRLNDYQFVRRLIEKKYVSSPEYDESVLAVLVESLDFGITKEELRLLFDRAPLVPPEMLSVAAKNKALLRQLSFDEKIIDDILFTGLANKSLTSRWLLFFRVVVAAERKGVSTARIAKVAKDVLIQKGDVGQILKELDFTFRDVKHGPHLDSPPGADEMNN